MYVFPTAAVIKRFKVFQQICDKMLLIDTAQDATDAGGTIKIIESSINYINTKTGCNEYYLWGGKLCIYNLQSDHEYLTVRFIPFF